MNVLELFPLAQKGGHLSASFAPLDVPDFWHTLYVAAGVTDMRKGFEGLYGLVRDRLFCEPLSGHLFLFCNAQRNRLKVLVWDGSGLWVCAKRLEKGRFTWPQSGDAQGKVVLSHEELSLLLGGIDLAKTKSKRWYRKAPPDGPVAA